MRRITWSFRILVFECLSMPKWNNKSVSYTNTHEERGWNEKARATKMRWYETSKRKVFHLKNILKTVELYYFYMILFKSVLSYKTQAAMVKLDGRTERKQRQVFSIPLVWREKERLNNISGFSIEVLTTQTFSLLLALLMCVCVFVRYTCVVYIIPVARFTR